MMAVGFMRSQAYRIRFFMVRRDIVARHSVRAGHPPCLANVDLRRETACSRELVSRIAPREHLGSDALGDSFIVTQKEKQTLREIDMLLHDALTRAWFAIWIFPVHADEVRRNCAAIIQVSLPVRDAGHSEEVAELQFRLGCDVTREQFKMSRIVAVWFGDLNAVLGNIRKAMTVVLSLHFAIAGMVSPAFCVLYAIDQLALCIVRIDGDIELVASGKRSWNDSGEWLPVLRRGFTTDRIAYACGGHEIAFI